MSGYNKKTGVYELTWTKANYWIRNTCEGSTGEKDMEFFAGKLRQQGLDVIDVYDAFLRVRATESQVWAALTGRPSTRLHASQ